MKVVNVVLSILILLLAVASAVFSFFLFEKRTQLVDGWNKMSTTINQSASEMDKGSGTDIGTKLTVSELSHEKYLELDGKLRQLTELSRKLIVQRDHLAETLQRIGSMAEMKNVPAADALKSMTTYPTSRDEVVNGVGALVDGRNRLAQSVSDAARQHLQVNSDVARLRSADRGTLEQFAQQLKQFGDERTALENALNEIGKQAGSGSLNFKGNNAKASLDKVRQAVNSMKAKLSESDRTIAARDQEIQRKTSEISGKNNEIATLKQQLDDKNYQLDSLRAALGIPVDQPLPMPWKPGSPEARKQLIGRVADVSDKYGYIAIDIGTDTTVPQQLGEKIGQINVELAPGLEMIVSRGDLEIPTSEYVAKVKLTKVEADCSIAEPVGIPGGSIKVGDKVWFEIN